MNPVGIAIAPHRFSSLRAGGMRRLHRDVSEPDLFDPASGVPPRNTIRGAAFYAQALVHYRWPPLYEVLGFRPMLVLGPLTVKNKHNESGLSHLLDARFDLTKFSDGVRQMWRKIIVKKELCAGRDSYRKAVFSAERGISYNAATSFLLRSTAKLAANMSVRMPYSAKIGLPNEISGSKTIALLCFKGNQRFA